MAVVGRVDERAERAALEAAFEAFCKAVLRVEVAGGEAGLQIKEIADAATTWARAVGRAYRRGLEEHELVRLWIGGQGSVRTYHGLPDLRSGAEKTAAEQNTACAFWLVLEASPLLEAGGTPVSVQNELCKAVNRPDYRPPLSFDGRATQTEPSPRFEAIRDELKQRLQHSNRRFSVWLQTAGLAD
jgi:hypothetical protein